MLRARGTSTGTTWSTMPAQPATEIERILAKIEQDNRILAELDHTRSTTHGKFPCIWHHRLPQAICIFQHNRGEHFKCIFQACSLAAPIRLWVISIRRHLRRCHIRTRVQRATWPSARATRCPLSPRITPPANSQPLAPTPLPIR